jgi:plastocyanin
VVRPELFRDPPDISREYTVLDAIFNVNGRAPDTRDGPRSGGSMTQWRLVVFPVLAVILAGCGGGGGYGTGPTVGPGTGSNPGGGGDPTGSNGNVVTLTNLSFDPSSMTVSAGSSVTWKWNDCSGADGYGGYTGCVAHNVTFDDGSNVASVTQQQGTFTRVFNAKGTFKYHCSIHGQPMSGQIVVQ